jgi:hypothetical protein
LGGSALVTLIYLGVFGFVAIGVSVFLMVRERKRRPKFEVLSGNAASGAFRDSRLEEEARRRP